MFCRLGQHDSAIKETSVIYQIFGGYLDSQVQCSECGNCSFKFDSFLDLGLEIDQSTTVAMALRSFCRAEFLHGQNGSRVIMIITCMFSFKCLLCQSICLVSAYACENCKRKVIGRKRFQIARAPPVLTIQLKRFKFHRDGSASKIQHHVSFDEHFDISSWTDQNATALVSAFR